MPESKPVQPPVAAPAPAAVPLPEKKTTTPWRVLEKTLLAPVWIKCQGYKPVFGLDLGCHTKFPTKSTTIAQSILAHIANDHGGGFQMKLKEVQKPWPGWAALEAAGIEALDFRCEVCDEKLVFNAPRLKRHLAPHSGKSRRVFPDFFATFNLHLAPDIPPPSDTDDEVPDDE